jgi:conjugative transfer region lipoprotein (TIGR03751 family)
MRWTLPMGVLTLALAGCSSSPNILPDRGDDIQTVYGKHLSGEIHAERAAPPAGTAESAQEQTVRIVQVRHDREPGIRDLNIDGFVRDQKSEIEPLFPLLPNPQLVLFVYPHLSPKGHPVPGYSVPFRMYEKDEYAMPGETKL